MSAGTGKAGVDGGAGRDQAVGAESRALALEVLARVEEDGAYANLALSAAIGRAGLTPEDRSLVTDLVNGTLRRRRYLDFVADRYLSDPPPPAARRVLRLGCYQLLERPDIPSYAAVSSTVSAAPRRFRGLVNAVLRRVAERDRDDPPEALDLATGLSYPDWVVDRLSRDLGEARAMAAMSTMNRAPTTSVRADGYVQDLSSQLVVEAFGVEPGALVVDLCAAPGGKATGLAGRGAEVVACDLSGSRLGLVAANAATTGTMGSVRIVRADAVRPPLRPGCARGVLLDAPCTGLGALRRRSDARWRIDPEAPERLAALQVVMAESARALLQPGGELVYSVCTLTAAESLGVDAELARRCPELVPLDAPGPPWEPWGRGAILLPGDANDGMCLFRYRLAAA